MNQLHIRYNGRSYDFGTLTDIDSATEARATACTMLDLPQGTLDALVADQRQDGWILRPEAIYG